MFKKLTEVGEVLREAVRAERLIVVAVCGKEKKKKYLFSRSHFNSPFGNKLDRLVMESQKNSVKRILLYLKAKPPFDHDIIRLGSLVRKTSVLFWFPHEFDVNEWKGSVIDLEHFAETDSAKADIIEKAFQKVDKIFKMVA